MYVFGWGFLNSKPEQYQQHLLLLFLLQLSSSSHIHPLFTHSLTHSTTQLMGEEQEDQNRVIKKSKKRKLSSGQEQEEDHNDYYLSSSLDELLNQDLLEKVLSWLPTSSFFRLRSVCKRWSSVSASSGSFRLACSQIPSRDPWFFMVDDDDDQNNLHQSIVFDTSERNWKHLPVTNNSYPPFDNNTTNNLIPVAASGGLICFRSVSTNGFVICNPVTHAFRELPPLPPTSQTQPLHAIAMNSSSSSSSYNLVLVYGEVPNLLSVIFYDSGKDCWEDEIRLTRRTVESSVEPPGHVAPGDGDVDDDDDDDEVLYFLSKTGDVVATDNNMQRSPTKQYSSVIIVKDGKEVICFLSSSGTVMACNPVGKCFYEYPRLLPVFLEYSIDVVECKGEMLVVVLSEFLGSASLRVWRFSEEDQSWCQVSAMPPSMSHEFYGKKADINCVGSGDHVLICVNSGEFNSCVLCDLVGNEWVELPKCSVNGKPKEFMSALSFEPRIEACV